VLSTALRERDRVEIYRPLLVDPKEARRLRPGLPAMLVTGFLAEAEDMLKHAARSGPIAVLRKPLPPELLSERIGALMEPQKLAV
jgi:hypothetical protein